MAVGKTKDGESFPAKPAMLYRQPMTAYATGAPRVPSLEKPVPLVMPGQLVVVRAASSTGNAGSGKATVGG